MKTGVTLGITLVHVEYKKKGFLKCTDKSVVWSLYTPI